MNEQWVTVEAEPFAEQPVEVVCENIESMVEVTQEIINLSSTPDYTGLYEFTPTDDTQVISIADHKALQNITINPIPSNYGRIEWNGSTLMVY